MNDRGASADDDDRRELYEQLLLLMRRRVTSINSQLQALSVEIGAGGQPPVASRRSDAPREFEERVVDQFNARDAAGNTYQIQVVRGFAGPDATSAGGPGSADIRLELRTEDGRPVNRIDFGTYQIVDGANSTEIWSADPKAL